MKTKKLNILVLAIVLLVTSLSMNSTIASGNPDQTSSRVSGLLHYHIKLKQEQAVHPDPSRLEQMQAMGLQVDDLSSQLAFIHFTQQPSPNEISEMQAMGIALYQDTWIPPVDDHRFGFMTAHVPVNRVYDLAGKDFVILLNTAEQTYPPMNDQGVNSINANDLWTLGYDGTGVKVAVLDSGLDVTHADIPTPTVGVDYSGFPITDTTIANQVTAHGTHVTGSVLGRGAYTTTYRGAAPDASLIFLKIGNDANGRASTAAEVAAIRAAVDTYGADIITMSYGGWSTYMDGTSEAAQAVDYAFSQGVVVFMSAGNEADNDRHYSGTVSGNSSTGFIRVNVANPSPDRTALSFRVIWWDGIGTSNDLDLEISDSSHNQITTTIVTTEEPESSRGTESDLTYYDRWLASAGTYYLKVVNNSATTQDFHIYSSFDHATFANPDPAYTVGSPATASDAIAVGAYVTRVSWTDWQGNGPWHFAPTPTLNDMATFSSQGPRADGVKKPNIAAPGSAIVSALDSGVATDNRYIISDSGINDGSQPHHYRVMQGTSMATPLAAGAAALLLDKYPGLKGHPYLIRDRMQRTADNEGVQTNTDGYGYLDILAAAKLIENPTSISPAFAGSHNSPSKIMVTIRKPAVGLSTNDFAVKIGGGNANVIILHEGQTEYVLEVMPPSQSTNGTYDLEVTVSGVSEIQTSAACYVDAFNVDVELVIDRSGSMGAEGKMEAAKQAAKQFVDLMHRDDMIGVVSFDDRIETSYPLTAITSQDVRNQARDAIDLLYARDYTSIGGGLQRGQEQLTTLGSASHPWAIVLLSDGLENTRPVVADVLPDIVASKTVVHTIGLGSDADEPLMQDIASQTGGTYHLAPGPQELAGIYNTISGAVSGQQTLIHATGEAQQGVTDKIDVVVDSTVSEATFSLTWANSASDIDLTLRKPNGAIVDPNVANTDPNIDYVVGSTYKYYRVRGPSLMTGVWKMRVTGGTIAPFANADLQRQSDLATTTEPYTVIASVQASLAMNTYFDRSNYLTTNPVRISASLSDHQPIGGATVTANVRRPSTVSAQIQALRWRNIGGDTAPQLEDVVALKQTHTHALLSMTLHDDGQHEDGLANDGVYAGTFPATRVEGTYTFSFDASGVSNGGDQFRRHRDESIYIAPNPSPRFVGAFLSFLSGSPVTLPGWHRGSGLGGRAVYGLSTAASTCNTLYAATDAGAYRSTNRGESWRSTGLGALLQAAKAEIPEPGPAFEGIDEFSNAPLTPAVAVCPSNSQTVYAATWGQGVYKSTDAGATWQPKNSGLEDLWLYALAVHPQHCQVVYAGTTAGGVFKSANGGNSWTPVNNGLTNLEVRSLAIAPSNPAVLYAGTTSGVFKTTDGGARWSPTGTLPGDRVRALAVHPSNPQVVYAGLIGHGLYKSSNGGSWWQPKTSGLGYDQARALAIDPLAPNTVYVGWDDGGGVYRSTNGGDNWSQRNRSLTERDVKSLLVDGGWCNTLHAGTTSGAWYYGP
jgi:subtilisin family serine protease